MRYQHLFLLSFIKTTHPAHLSMYTYSRVYSFLQLECSLNTQFVKS